MLLKIIVNNFKSFNAPQEFSMIPGKKLKDKRDHKVETKFGSVLKNAIMYGANASGKTSFVEVFDFLKETVIRGLPLNCNNYFCKIYPENINKESYFEIILALDNKRYSYCFKTLFKKRTITYESLDLIESDNSKSNIFTRSQGEVITQGNALKLNRLEKSRFNIYKMDFLGYYKKLFLASMAQGKNYEDDSGFFIFKRVYHYLKNNIIVLNPNRGISNSSLYEGQGSLDDVSQLLRSFDTGIEKICLKKISMNELREKIPSKILVRIFSTAKRLFRVNDEHTMQITCRNNGNLFNILIKKDQEPIVTTISLNHYKSVFDFEFSEESDGTQRIFDLMDILLTKRQDTVYIIDELERSLHPLLTQKFLEKFKEIYSETNTQLIFTTHDNLIMNLELFRKDEIWFTEKNPDGSTRLYVLNDFGERYDKAINKAYLRGDYGAIPKFQAILHN